MALSIFTWQLMGVLNIYIHKLYKITDGKGVTYYGGMKWVTYVLWRDERVTYYGGMKWVTYVLWRDAWVTYVLWRD